MKFVYFDLGNVFFTYDQVFTTVMEDLGISSEFEKIIEQNDDDAMNGKITIPEVWQKICLQLNTPQYTNYNLIQSWVSDYQSISSMPHLVKEVSRKYSIGVLSNMYLKFFDEILRQKIVPDDLNFNSIVISAEVGFVKPQPEIYQIAEQKSGFSGADIFFIDDKLVNLDEATRHGWQTFLFDYKHPKESVDKLRSILLP